MKVPSKSNVHYYQQKIVSVDPALRRIVMAHALTLAILILLHGVHSSYLTGAVPEGFLKGDTLMVKVNKLTSTKTQLPYSYYSLPYRSPPKILNSAEILEDRIENSPYVFKMLDEQKCNVLCRITVDARTANEFEERIGDEYRVHMNLDNLPLVVPITGIDEDSPSFYQLGFRIGLIGQYAGSNDNMYFINNHLAFTVKYHKDQQSGAARIVGFEVKPFSIQHEYEGAWNGPKTHLNTCDPQRILTYSSPQRVVEKKEIIFTYDVHFQESDVKWESRWDAYLTTRDDRIHCFSIIYSLAIVLFLSGMVAMIILRTLYRDISRYNEVDNQEEAQEETGWKLLHGDAFRTPANSDLLCVYVGTGVQFLGMTLTFAVLRFLYPMNGGDLVTTMFLVSVSMSLFAGYASARLYKMFKGTEWKRIALRTAIMFPGTISVILLALNALVWSKKSSGAVPFGLAFLWFIISVPLVFVGSYVGFKKAAIEDPVKTSKIPRETPEKAWYKSPALFMLIGGVLPFGSVYVELFFILNAMWLHQIYYVSGFLLLALVVLVVTCAEMAILLCYLQLCGEDYRWWWRACLTSGSSAMYLFLYATFYFFAYLEITSLLSGALYFGSMLIVSLAFFLLTGTVGFYACFCFTRLLYSSLKVD